MIHSMYLFPSVCSAGLKTPFGDTPTHTQVYRSIPPTTSLSKKALPDPLRFDDEHVAAITFISLNKRAKRFCFKTKIHKRDSVLF